jgi:hypothetical protein
MLQKTSQRLLMLCRNGKKQILNPNILLFGKTNNIEIDTGYRTVLLDVRAHLLDVWGTTWLLRRGDSKICETHLQEYHFSKFPHPKQGRSYTRAHDVCIHRRQSIYLEPAEKVGIYSVLSCYL